MEYLNLISILTLCHAAARWASTFHSGDVDIT